MDELRAKALKKIREYLEYMERSSKEPISILGDLYLTACGKIRMAEDLGLITSCETNYFIKIAAKLSVGE